MWNFVMPALTAIGINSGMNLIRKKPIFENAATAGVTGGVLGGYGQPGGIFGSTPVQTASNTIVPGSIESALGQAGADGVLRNPEYFSNILGNQVYTGNEGLLSQIGTGAGSIFDSVQSTLGDELTPQNLLGVSMLMNNMSQARPMPSMGGGGREIRGTPPKLERFATGQVYGRKKRGNA